MKILKYLFFTIIIFSACTKEIPFEEQFPFEGEKIVLFAQLTPDNIIKVSVSKSYGTFDLVFLCGCDEAYDFASPDDDFNDVQDFITNANITASNLILAPGDVYYEAGITAGNFIELFPGFEVDPGAIFEATLGGCQP